jgi:hypothetical protein
LLGRDVAVSSLLEGARPLVAQHGWCVAAVAVTSQVLGLKVSGRPGPVLVDGCWAFVQLPRGLVLRSWCLAFGGWWLVAGGAGRWSLEWYNPGHPEHDPTARGLTRSVSLCACRQDGGGLP